MKRLFTAILSISLFSLTSVFAHIDSNDMRLNINEPQWHVKASYPGLLNSTGYFHYQKWNGALDIYGSSRTIKESDVDRFLEYLYPLDEHLAPYATPNWKKGAVYNVQDIEDTTVGGLRAKRITAEVTYPDRGPETVVTYLMAKPREGVLGNTNTGYTISFSCAKGIYKDRKDEINTLVREMSFIK